MSTQLAAIATVESTERLGCGFGALPLELAPAIRYYVACRAGISINPIESASDVRCSLQDKPLPVDAELDTRLALWPAKDLMVHEKQHRNLACLVLPNKYRDDMNDAGRGLALDRRNVRVTGQLRKREFFVGHLVRT